MVEFEVEQPIQSEGLRLRTVVPQNSEEVESSTEDVDVVREESNSQPNSRVTAFPSFVMAISLIQICAFYMGGKFSWLYLGYDPSRRHEVWRFLTKMFVHSSASHLWGNVIVQLLCGVPLEIIYHWKLTAIIYTGGVFGGTLFSSFFIPRGYSVGASAGVYALNFAQVSIILLCWNYIGNKCRVFLSFVLACKVYGDGQTVYSDLVAETVSNTNHVAHFGGALTGFLISIRVLKILEERPWMKSFQRICTSILIALTLIVVLTNIAFPSLYPETEFNTDYERTYILRVFKIIDKCSTPSDHPFLINCLKAKECADAWDDYKNTGKVTDAHFLDLFRERFLK